MKSNRHFKSILIFCILFSTLGQSHAQQYSHAFQALLNQIQQNYLAQKGDNLSSLRNRYPTVVATLIGNALRTISLRTFNGKHAYTSKRLPGQRLLGL
jgi:hypothetical protein